MSDIFPGFPYAYLHVKHQDNSLALINKLEEQYRNEKEEEKKKADKRIKLLESKLNKDNKEDIQKKIDKVLLDIKKQDSQWIRRNWMTIFENRERNCFYFSTKLDIKELLSYKKIQDYDLIKPVDPKLLESKGLKLIPDFISEEEEKELLKKIYEKKFENLSMRRVQNYGFRFIFGPNLVKTDKPITPIPEEYKSSISKLYNNEQISSILPKNENKNETFDQLTITEYKPGEGALNFIESHKTFEEAILIVSLRSDTVMSFQNNISGDIIEVLIPRFSLLLLSGEIRYMYSQGIPGRKIDKLANGTNFRKHRVTLTFRKTKETKGCSCEVHEVCDDSSKTTKGVESLPIFQTSDKSNDILGFEKEHVEDVYNNIAEHFSHTRYKPWPKVYEYLVNLPKGSLVGDIGCGNGKYIFCESGHHFLGVDVAVNFAKICKKRGKSTQVLVADSSDLPLRSDILDHAISIAVIHHFVSHGKIFGRLFGFD